MRKLACLAMLFFVAVFQQALAADWKMNAADSRLEFAATFENVPAPGVFKEFNTLLHFDPVKPVGSRLDVTINITSADMASGDINKAIAGPEWFDFAGHPQAEFHSTDIRRSPSGPQSYVARGMLGLKGVQHPVEVLFTWNAMAGGALMEGGFTVKRGPFGIGTGEWTATDVIGPDVGVKFYVLMHKGG